MSPACQMPFDSSSWKWALEALRWGGWGWAVVVVVGWEEELACGGGGWAVVVAVGWEERDRGGGGGGGEGGA